MPSNLDLEKQRADFGRGAAPVNDRTYIVHIHERIGRILGFTVNGREDFLDSPMIQDAVLRNFEVIGRPYGVSFDIS